MTVSEKKLSCSPAADTVMSVMTVAAVLSSMLLCGASDWYLCIIPAALLLAVSCLKIKHTAKNVYGLLFILMLFSAALALFCAKTDKQKGIYGLEQLICFFAAFYVGGAAEGSARVKKYILTGTLLVAAVGLFFYCVPFGSGELVIVDRGIRRLQSVFRYANTAAAVLGCGYYFSLDISDDKNILARVCPLLMLAAMYLTFSKAAIPMFLCIGGALICFKRDKAKRFIIDNAICIALAAVFLAVYLSHGKGGYAPAETMVKRMVYMRDALGALRQNPFIGAGSGAWRYLQYTVQSAEYNVLHIHNGWLEFWLENGLVFVLSLLTLTVIAILKAVRSRDWTVAAAISLIALHSLIDFDMSFGAVLVVYGLLLGCAARNENGKYITAAVNSGIFVLMCAAVLYMGAEYTVRSSFEASYIENKTDEAAEKAYRLKLLCPYDSELRVSIAALLNGNAASELSEARRLSPLDPEIMRADIEYMLDTGGNNITESCKDYIDMAPKQEKVYALADAYAKDALDKGLCTSSEYDDFVEYKEKRRNLENVTDRNKLLEDIVKQKETENTK